MTGFVVDADAEGVILGKKEINMGMHLGINALTRQVNVARIPVWSHSKMSLFPLKT